MTVWLTNDRAEWNLIPLAGSFFQEEDLPNSYNKLLVRTVCCEGQLPGLRLPARYFIRLCYSYWSGGRNTLILFYSSATGRWYPDFKIRHLRPVGKIFLLSVQSKFCYEALLCSFPVCTRIVRSDLHLTSLCLKEKILFFSVWRLSVWG